MSFSEEKTLSKLFTTNSSEEQKSTAHDYNFFDYKRSRSNSPNNEPHLLDLSYLDLEECESNLHLSIQTRIDGSETITNLLLNNNVLKQLPPIVAYFSNIITLDLSCNYFKYLSDDICKLVKLKHLIARDNQLEDMSFPKDFGTKLNQLEIINLSGNLLTQFPYQLLEMKTLREIYLGSNKITSMPRNYESLQRLEILYLGGNQLKTIPDELCQLKSLTSLNLSNNQITYLPNILAKLKNIQNLALHNNNLTHLPIELVKLNLYELSLRNNPLVSRFAREFTYNVPSLLELSGRTIKTRNISYGPYNLPKHLINYLNSAKCCLNPKCKGVYFTSKVEHIKFVDFCGKFRVPLMQYLCSSTCNEKITNANSSALSFDSSSDSDDQIENKILKKILLG